MIQFLFLPLGLSFLILYIYGVQCEMVELN